MAGFGVSPIGPRNIGSAASRGTSVGLAVPGRSRPGSGPAGAAPRPKTPDYSAILKSFSPSATPAAPAQPMVNTSTPNPTINSINDAQMKDFQGDMNAGNLSRQSDIEIRDAAESERKAARQNAAARGVSSGGVEDIQQAGITSSVLSNQTKARVGIKNDAEARRAALGAQIAGQAAMDENLQNQQRNTGINQQSELFREQQSARDSELARFSKILDFFGAGTIFN